MYRPEFAYKDDKHPQECITFASSSFRSESLERSGIEEQIFMFLENLKAIWILGIKSFTNLCS